MTNWIIQCADWYLGILYEYPRTRKANHPEIFLKGFQSVVVYDGYSAYPKLDCENPDITFAGTWHHLQ
nr:IS66 family transposase [Blautia marasmi]